MRKRNLTVILTKDIQNLGKEGDEVQVKLGYARNFLLPNKFAVLVTPVALERAHKVREERKKKEAKLLSELKQHLAKLKDLSLEFIMKVKKDSKELYGSVSPTEIAKRIKKKVLR